MIFECWPWEGKKCILDINLSINNSSFFGAIFSYVLCNGWLDRFSFTRKCLDIIEFVYSIEVINSLIYCKTLVCLVFKIHLAFISPWQFLWWNCFLNSILSVSYPIICVCLLFRWKQDGAWNFSNNSIKYYWCY